MKKCFESSFGHFFPAGYGSIYPALATLARNGLVEFEEIPQDGKPDRKVYSITEKGRETLMQALTTSEPTHRIRSEFLAVLWFADLMPEERIGQLIDAKLGEIDTFLELLEEFENCEGGRAEKGPKFVAGFGRHMAKAFREYLVSNREILTKDGEEHGVRAVGGR